MKDNKVWQAENAHLQDTISIIDEQIKHLNGDVEQTKQFVQELRDYYVRGTQIFGDIDPQERVSINERIDNLVDIGNQSIDKIESLKRNRARPYFGRVRFEGREVDDFYIGLMGIEQNNHFYVYDWRAPICELFYDYGLGKAKYKNVNVPVFTYAVDQTKLNLAESIRNIFQKGVDEAVKENERQSAINNYKEKIDYVEAVDEQLDSLDTAEQEALELNNTEETE